MYSRMTWHESDKYAPHNLIRNCAHLIGETIFVPAIFLCGDGRGPSREPYVLLNCAARGIADL